MAKARAGNYGPSFERRRAGQKLCDKCGNGLRSGQLFAVCSPCKSDERAYIEWRTEQEAREQLLLRKHNERRQEKRRGQAD